MLLQLPERLIQAPDGAWTGQHARRLVRDLAGRIHAFGFFIPGRDAKVTAGVRQPPAQRGRADRDDPAAGSPGELPCRIRRVPAVRAECTDRMLIYGQRHRRSVLYACTRHDHRHRPQQSGHQRPPEYGEPGTVPPGALVRRRTVPGGVIGEYHRAG